MEFSFILATYDRCEPLNRRLLSGIATGFRDARPDYDSPEDAIQRKVNPVATPLSNDKFCSALVLLTEIKTLAGANRRCDGESFYA
jgi:hypothetical protein